MTEIVDRVVASGFCTGCGACAGLLGSKRLVMQITDGGELRPTGGAKLSQAERHDFLRFCPGVNIAVDSCKSATTNREWGPIVRTRAGHALDVQLRREGSSGGAVSALALHLLESGQVDFVAQIAADVDDPLRNVVQQSRTRDDVLKAAGSRYAPAAPLEKIDQYLRSGLRFAIVGKPCDIAAVRNLGRTDPRVQQQIPFLISFMCAGVPSLQGTQELLQQLGVEESELESFRYRGDGWPGMARAVARDGRVAEMDYGRSWGTILNRHLQFRCKICPDGTGETADVVCADAWYGKDGYPDFAERDGRSLIITRTARGEALVSAAMQSGALAAEDLDIAELARMQPYQLARKRLVLARLAGTWLRRGWVPRYRGLRLMACSVQAGLGEWLRNALGTWRRATGERP